MVVFGVIVIVILIFLIRRVDNYEKNKKEERNKYEKEWLLSGFFENEKLNIMIRNFLSNMPPKYFIDIEYIIGIECNLEKINTMDTESYMTHDYKVLRENYDFESENCNIKHFIDNDFCMFAKILKNKYEEIESLDVAKNILYQLLLHNIPSFYSDEWEEEYGTYFNSLENPDTNELMKIYCEIESFDHANTINIGRFSYYIYENFELDDVEEATDDYISIYQFVENSVKDIIEENKLLNFEKKLMKKKEKDRYTIDDIDSMGGLEFESFVELMFSNMGYSSKVTKATGDQGIDVIAEKNGKKFGIQAKCYSSPVTNSAIQEAVAGISYYKLDKAMVITNNFFTKSAKQLGESNNVVLWDRDKLMGKLEDVCCYKI